MHIFILLYVFLSKGVEAKKCIKIFSIVYWVALGIPEGFVAKLEEHL
jgi:hypothetical protein